MTNDLPDRVEVRERRLYFALTAAGGLLFASAGPWMALSSTGFDRGIGWACAVFGVLVVVVAAPSVVAPRVILVVDDHGFVDRSGMAAVGRVTWADVRQFRVIAGFPISIVLIDLIDPDRLRNGLGPIRRWAARSNSAFTGADLTMMLVGLDRREHDVLAALCWYRSRWIAGDPSATV